MDIEKVNELDFLNEEVEEFTRRWGQSLVKDTAKTYFCYRHTLLETTTLSRLFYLF